MKVDLPKPFFVLAPMDDVTDTVFRQVVAEMAAPDLFFTEFVNVDGLMSPGRPNLLKKLRFAAKEGRVVAQLWGLNPDNFRAVAGQIADGSMARELGLPDGVNFYGVDLNMGCPAKTEVKNGACAALIKLENRPLAEQIIAATRQGLAGRLPLSVKTRVGFSTVDMSWFEFLLSQELDMLTVHGRTRKQMSKVPADWDLIGKVREMRDAAGVSTLIVGNGDVMSRAQGEELAKKYQLDGIMIGRGIFHDPYIFAQNDHLRVVPIDWAKYDQINKIELYKKHVELFAETWQSGERPVHTLNKFCKMYIQGFDGAAALREKLMAATSPAELLRLLNVGENVKIETNEIRTIISDADGTLIDTMDLIRHGQYEAVATYLEQREIQTSDIPTYPDFEKVLHQTIGGSARITLERTVREIFKNSSVSIEHLDYDELHDLLNPAQDRLAPEYVHAYPGLSEFLHGIGLQGLNFAIWTSGTAHHVVRNFGLALPELGLVDLYKDRTQTDNDKLLTFSSVFKRVFGLSQFTVVTCEDILTHKPDPEGIALARRRLNADLRATMVLGDHGVDMQAAQNAGITNRVGITHGFGAAEELLRAGATKVVASLGELTPDLQQ